MSDKTTPQESADINKAIAGFGKESLTEEQELQLKQVLHAQMMNATSITDTIKIVSSFVADSLEKQFEEMTDDQKVQTYKALDLK
jgi:hypothetical protein